MKDATMTSNPAYENVPVGIPLALTLEQAAARLDVKASYFRTTMTKLNGTDQDLRSPQQPGERSRKYDVDKLDAWKTAGMPVPKDPLRTPQAAPGARVVQATATRKDGSWVVDLPDIGQGTRTENLRNAQRVAHALAADTLGLSLNEVTVNLVIRLPEDAAQKWRDAKTKEREAREAAASASRLSRQVIRDLRNDGLTLEDIGALLGLGLSRVHQLAHESR
jgi:hypothetical protein